MLQLDAHADTWESYFGRAVTHGTVMRRAAEEGLIDAGRSVQVGLRGPLYSADDYAQDRALGFRTLLARELDGVGVEGALALARDGLRSPVYVSLDIDVLDPAFAPGTGTPEIAGFSTAEAVGFIRALRGVNLVACDVVEVSPSYDGPGQQTALAAANVMWELLALHALGR